MITACVCEDKFDENDDFFFGTENNRYMLARRVVDGKEELLYTGYKRFKVSVRVLASRWKLPM